MRIYIAGPIAGYPDANRKAFSEAADLLRRDGYTPINPHEVPPQEHPGQDCPPGLPGGEDSEHLAPCYMKTDLAALLTCDAIWMLPGWHKSQGARIEYLIARHVVGMSIMNNHVRPGQVPPPSAVLLAFNCSAQ